MDTLALIFGIVVIGLVEIVGLFWLAMEAFDAEGRDDLR